MYVSVKIRRITSVAKLDSSSGSLFLEPNLPTLPLGVLLQAFQINCFAQNEGHEIVPEQARRLAAAIVQLYPQPSIYQPRRTDNPAGIQTRRSTTPGSSTTRDLGYPIHWTPQVNGSQVPREICRQFEKEAVELERTIPYQNWRNGGQIERRTNRKQLSKKKDIAQDQPATVQLRRSGSVPNIPVTAAPRQQPEEVLPAPTIPSIEDPTMAQSRPTTALGALTEDDTRGQESSTTAETRGRNGNNRDQFRTAPESSTAAASRGRNTNEGDPSRTANAFTDEQLQIIASMVTQAGENARQATANYFMDRDRREREERAGLGPQPGESNRDENVYPEEHPRDEPQAPLRHSRRPVSRNGNERRTSMVPQGRNRSSNRRPTRRNTLNRFPGGGDDPSSDDEPDQAPRRDRQGRRDPSRPRRDGHRRRRGNTEFSDDDGGYPDAVADVDTRDKRKFSPEEIGYFNPYLDEKEYGAGDVVSKGNKIYYRSVHLFIDAFKYATLDLSSELVRRNLHKCLQGGAATWFIHLLTDDERMELRGGRGVERWEKKLFQKFKTRSTVAYARLEAERYGPEEVRKDRPVADFVMNVVRWAKEADITDPHAQLSMAWNKLDPRFQNNVPKPRRGWTVEDLIEEIEDRKEAWDNFYHKKGQQYNQQTTSVTANRDRETTRQPQNASRSGNVGRPDPRPSYNEYRANTYTQQQFRPQSASATTQNWTNTLPTRGYASQPNVSNQTRPQTQPPNVPNRGYTTLSYGNQQAPGGNKPTGWNNNQPARPQAPWSTGQQFKPAYQSPYANQQAPAPNPRYPNQSAYPNQQQTTNYQRQETQRTNYTPMTYPSGNYPPQPAPQRVQAFAGHAHDVSLKEEELEEPTENKENSGEVEASTGEPDEQDPTGDPEPFDDYPEEPWMGFVSAMPPSPLQMKSETLPNLVDVPAALQPVRKEHTTELEICRNCQATFPSRNKLHRHLKTAHRPSDTTEKSQEKPPTSMETDRDPKEIWLMDQAENDLEVLHSVPQFQFVGPGFRDWHYAKIPCRLSDTGPFNNYGLDTGCTTSVVDRELLTKLLPNIAIKKEERSFPVRGIGDTVVYCTDYTETDVYFRAKLRDKPIIIMANLRLRIMDHLKPGVLLGMDFIGPQELVINVPESTVTFGRCDGASVDISVCSKRHTNINFPVRVKETTVVPPRKQLYLAVTHKELPSNRDYEFSPSDRKDLNDIREKGGVIYAAITDSKLSQIPIRNESTEPLTVRKHILMGQVQDTQIEGCYTVGQESQALAAMGEHEELEPGMETKLPSGITVYGKPAVVKRIAGVVDEFPDLFKDRWGTVKIPPEDYLQIPLKDDWHQHKLLTKPYNNGVQDQKIIDAQFDKLHSQGKMEWSTKSTPFGFPVFVTWRTVKGPDGQPTRKSRVVVDIRGLNAVSIKDSYPLPLQSDILNSLRGSTHISTIDAISFFYQWLVAERDRHKLTVNSHRGQEHFKVAVMGYCNSAQYVQRQLDNLLRNQRDFVRAYIDDIVIFSKSLEDHLHHLRTVFGLFDSLEISLAGPKSFLGYPTATLLGQRVDALGLATDQERIRALLDLEFPTTLASLEHYLGITGFLRQYVPYYIQIAGPLQQLKTKLLTVAPRAGNARKSYSSRQKIEDPTTEELEAFAALRTFFRDLVGNWIHHFDPLRYLFIDVDTSKEYGVGAMVYHVRGDPEPVMSTSPEPVHAEYPEGAYLSQQHAAADNRTATTRWLKRAAHFPRKDIQPICFLSRALKPAETRYYITELEMMGLVWTIQKVKPMVEAAKRVFCFTDHAAITAISQQTHMANTTSLEKMNLRLVRASQYFSQFGNIDVRYRPGHIHIVPDALSRLIAKPPKEPPTLKSTSEHEEFDQTIFHIAIVEMAEEFKKRLQTAYEQDGQWKKVLELISKTQERTRTDREESQPNPEPSVPVDQTNPSTDAPVNVPPAPESAEPVEQATSRTETTARNSPVHTPTNAPPAAITVTPNEAPELQSCPLGTRFFSRRGLIYFKDHVDGRERLCIPQALEKDIFNLAHDQQHHGGFDRTFARVRASYYIRHLRPHLREYIDHCPQCGMNQTQRHKPYGELNPTGPVPIPFHTIAADFIMKMPITSSGFDALMTNTDTFTKKHLLIPGQEEWGAELWAKAWLKALRTCDWGIPVKFISDRDTRFLSDFWQEVFRLLRCKHLASTAYHPQTDGQSERTNQTVEIALRFFVTEYPEEDWDEVIPHVQATLNNSANASTGTAPNEILYGFKTNQEPLQALTHLPEEDYATLRQQFRNMAEDSLEFAVTMMKHRYDARHKLIRFKPGEKVHLRLHKGYKIQGHKNQKFSHQRTEPLTVKRAVGKLAYELELPPVMKIHPVVSVSQLERAPSGPDPYERMPPQNQGPVYTEGDEEGDRYEIERLCGRRTTARGIKQYLVKWAGWGPSHNVWYDREDLGGAEELMEDYDRLHPTDPPQTRAARRRARINTNEQSEPEETRPRRRGRPARGASPAA